MQIGFKSDRGRVREKNEDAFLAEYPVFAVADGMGGLPAGEQASKIAINALKANKGKLQHSRKPLWLLGEILKLANKKIMEAGTDELSFGMGTTLTAVFVKNKKAYVGHIGDCCLYVINDQKIRKITEEHSLVQELVKAKMITPEEARTHPNRNVITKALGITKDPDPDLLEIDLKPKDRLLIVSDGVTSLLSDSELKDIVSEEIQADRTCSKIIEIANERGGNDNATVVFVSDIVNSNQRNKRTIDTAIMVLEFTAALLIAVGILLFYLANQFYIKVENQSIVLYQGHPARILGISFSRKLIEKPIEEKDIPDWYIDRLQEGIAVEDYDEGVKAVNYVESYSFTND